MVKTQVKKVSSQQVNHHSIAILTCIFIQNKENILVHATVMPTIINISDDNNNNDNNDIKDNNNTFPHLDNTQICQIPITDWM